MMPKIDGKPCTSCGSDWPLCINHARANTSNFDKLITVVAMASSISTYRAKPEVDNFIMSVYTPKHMAMVVANMKVRAEAGDQEAHAGCAICFNSYREIMNSSGQRAESEARMLIKLPAFVQMFTAA